MIALNASSQTAGSAGAGGQPAAGAGGVITNQFVTITNEFGVITNVLLSQSNAFVIGTTPQNLTPTATLTNVVRVFPTNAGGLTNFSATVTQDRAVTAPDRALLVQIHRSLRDVFTPGTGLVPIHFIVQQGVVRIVGFVSTLDEKQRLLAAVQAVQGVVQVQDEVSIRPRPGALSSTTGVAPITNQFGNVSTNLPGAPLGSILGTNLPPTSESNAANRIFVFPSGVEVQTNATPQQ